MEAETTTPAAAAAAAAAPQLKLSCARHAHTLTLRDFSREFTCDMCARPDSGRRYRCDDCDYDLHEACATCPDSAALFTHPDHPLLLVKSRNPLNRLRHCDVCGDHVKGFHYRCKPCAVEVHPACLAALRPVLSDGAHPGGHELAYESFAVRVPCKVCEENCEGWRYFCRECDVHIHFNCLQANSKKGAEKKKKGEGDGHGGKGKGKKGAAGGLMKGALKGGGKRGGRAKEEKQGEGEGEGEGESESESESESSGSDVESASHGGEDYSGGGGGDGDTGFSFEF